jgi:hypothetical protein
MDFELNQANAGGVSVPSPDDPWEAIWPFALSYNGYERYGKEPGGLQGEMSVGDFANHTHSQWLQDGSLPSTLHELRSILFYEQRRSRMGFALDFDAWEEWGNPKSRYSGWIAYMKVLLQAIREISGDHIDSPSDLALPD